LPRKQRKTLGATLFCRTLYMYIGVCLRSVKTINQLDAIMLSLVLTLPQRPRSHYFSANRALDRANARHLGRAVRILLLTKLIMNNLNCRVCLHMWPTEKCGERSRGPWSAECGVCRKLRLFLRCYIVETLTLLRPTLWYSFTLFLKHRLYAKL